MYSIPRALTRYIVNFIESANGVLMPFFAEQNLQKNKTTLKQTFLLFSNIFNWFLLTAAAFVLMFGADFIDIWLDFSAIYR